MGSWCSTPVRIWPLRSKPSSLGRVRCVRSQSLSSRFPPLEDGPWLSACEAPLETPASQEQRRCWTWGSCVCSSSGSIRVAPRSACTLPSICAGGRSLTKVPSLTPPLLRGPRTQPREHRGPRRRELVALRPAPSQHAGVPDQSSIVLPGPRPRRHLRGFSRCDATPQNPFEQRVSTARFFAPLPRIIRAFRASAWGHPGRPVLGPPPGNARTGG